MREENKVMLQELMELEERLDHFYLTRERRNEFQHEIKELQRLAEIGRATEKVFEEWPYIESAYVDGKDFEYKSVAWEGLDELIGWYMEKEEAD